MLVVRLPQEDEVMGEHCAVNEWSLQELATELLASAKEVSAEFGPWPDFEAAAERASRELAAKDAEIATAKVTITELAEQFDTLRADRDATARHLGELLAVIHRDGGQYQTENGVVKAVEDALSKLSSLRCELYDLRGEYEETAALFGAWKQRAEQAESERDEARECVKRLCETLTAIRDSTCTSATTLSGHAGVVLAATPEHLRP